MTPNREKINRVIKHALSHGREVVIWRCQNICGKSDNICAILRKTGTVFIYSGTSKCM